MTALRLPKTAEEAESQAGREHSVSNDHLELTVRIPDNGVCSAGSTIRVRAHAVNAQHFEGMTLRLVGETTARLMAKARLQAGAIMNMSTPGGGGVPISGFERYTFLDHDIPLSAPAPTPSNTVGDPKFETEPYVDKEGFLKLQLPFPTKEQLLPTLPKQDNAALDQTDISVRWTLQLLATRKGIFRPNKKLSLDLPISFPSTPWRYSYVNEVSTSKKLKFEGAETDDLSVEAKLTCDPIATLGAPLKFTLHLTPYRQQVASFLSTASFASTAPTCFFTRQIYTAPIESFSAGRPFDWPAVRIGKNGEVRQSEQPLPDEGLEWVGEVTPPDNEYTIDSKGVGVKYALVVQVSSSIFADGTLRVSLPVFFPSSPIDVDGISPRAPPPDTHGVDPSLPVYEP
ncbi:hypothetical protein JCM6882_001054 [Rhodosporidiobolus microsporus]